MKARITIHNYNEKISTYQGEYNKDNSTNIITIIFSSLILEGNDKGDEGVRLTGTDHTLQLYWKNPWSLRGKWKSTNGEWEKITISMKEKKERRMIDWWDDDHFSDVVETTLIAFLEKMTCKEGYDKLFRIKPNQFNFLKKIGPYFTPFMNYSKSDNRRSPFQDEDVSDRFTEDHAAIFLADYDRPTGVISVSVSGNQDKGVEDSAAKNMTEKLGLQGSAADYITYRTANTYMYYLKPEPSPHKDLGTIPELWNNWSRPYALYKLAYRDEGGIFGYKIPLRIDFRNNLIGPIFPMSFTKALNGKNNGLYELPEDFQNKTMTKLTHIELQKSCRMASIMLDCDEMIREKEMWKIIALEGKSKCTFSVDYEQIKSLFYARDAPVTQTGRLRYIKHWVRSHQRRVGEGTDFTNIPKHLRGEENITIGTTRFKIIHP
jgi:hypothetical protein